MKKALFYVPAMATVALVCSAAFGQTALTKKSDGILVNSAGMTLYIFDKDVAGSGKSGCNGPCAGIWPALTAAGVPATPPYSVVTRDDGAMQLAYNGKPLYLYVSDKKPGDRAGDNFKDVWHVVKD